jgi:hypothetical protein
VLANRHLSADAVVAVSVSLQAVARQESVCRATHRLVNGEPRRKVTPTLSRSPLLGSLPLTIAEIPPERRAIQKLAAFSGFVPTNALAPTIRCGPRGSGFAGAPCRLVGTNLAKAGPDYFRIVDPSFSIVRTAPRRRDGHKRPHTERIIARRLPLR